MKRVGFSWLARLGQQTQNLSACPAKYPLTSLPKRTIGIHWCFWNSERSTCGSACHQRSELRVCEAGWLTKETFSHQRRIVFQQQIWINALRPARAEKHTPDLVLCPACLSSALQATQSVNDTVPPFCPSSLWDQHVSIPASVLLLLFITTSLQVPDCPTREVLMLKAEKCQFENYNFSTPWSVEGAPPFVKAVIPLPLFVKALYQLLLFKDTCKDGMCLSFKTLAKWVELSLKWCGLFPSQ